MEGIEIDADESKTSCKWGSNKGWGTGISKLSSLNELAEDMF